MFREIRHRVKNNLQIVASLLNLQADGSSKTTAKALYESRRRVLAMAFVHEELYSSESLDRVGLAEYLSRLSVSVRDGADQERRIRFSSDFDQITLEIERAVPFGLIANEVLMNAYMHAFPPERYDGGTICMRLKYGPEGRATFIVEDDGIGLPSSIDRTLKLGLTLIETLASQINAKIEYGRPEGGGTHFSMNFSAHMMKTKACDDVIDTSVVLSMNTDSTIL
jgi:two-component sensor histidine kinase